MSWKSDLKRYLLGREQLDSSGHAQEFGVSDEAKRAALDESLRVFEEEYGFAVGLLRSSDSLAIFVTPPPTKSSYVVF